MSFAETTTSPPVVDGDSSSLRFHWSDYVVFIVSLVASGAVGVIQGIMDHVKNSKKGDKQEAKVGERNISVWPASLSVMASTLAAPFVLGVPAEMYAYGTQFSLIIVGYAIGIPLCTHLFYTRFYDMGITSVYEYLEFRFNKTVRSMCTFIFAFSIIVYMGIITYAPAVAFSQVTGLSLQISILGVGLIGIVYTTVGGLKGVIWVDAIQMLITIAGILAVIIKGAIDVGGMGKVWSIANADKRIEFAQMSVNPSVRHTFWTQTIGGMLAITVVFTNQAIVQKFLGLPSKKKMLITSYASMVVISSYLAMSCLAGVVMYAYYASCSPLEMAGGKVKKFDQLLPVFVLEIFKGIYGIPGLFTASVFSASLSSLAGGINALAAVTILDVINPLYFKYSSKKQFSPRNLIFLFKGLVFGYGLVTIGFAYLAPYLGEGLLQLALNLMGVVGAPMLALFFMGIFIPCINAIGAGVGLIVSVVTMMWISTGGIMIMGKYKTHIKAMLPFRNDSCLARHSITQAMQTMTCTTASSVTTDGFSLASVHRFHPITGVPIADHSDAPQTILSTLFEMTTGQVQDASTAIADALTGQPEFMRQNLQTAATTGGNLVSDGPSGIEILYTASYMWYYVIAMVIAIVVAFLVSLCTGFRRGEPVDLTLSYRCCYTDVKEQLVDEEGYITGYPEKTPLSGSHANPAFSPPLSNLADGASRKGSLHESHDANGLPATVGGGVEESVTGAGEPFGEYDDSGVYGYGIFTRDRCSRCRRSRIVRCTRF